jgi:hypothetical protein
MRYNEIITEANYRNKIDTSRSYPTQSEFDSALKSKFGISGPNKESKPQAGGGIYIMNAKGIVGYKAPNTDSPEGFVWFVAKEPFMPSLKKKTPVAVKPTDMQVDAPKGVKSPISKIDKPVNIESALRELLNTVKSIHSNRKWGNYDARGPEQEGDRWVAEIRYWGNWQVPDGEDDDGDYDWEELTGESAMKLQQIIDEYSKRYPSVKFYWQTGEKNWIYLYARAK